MLGARPARADSAPPQATPTQSGTPADPAPASGSDPAACPTADQHAASATPADPSPQPQGTTGPEGSQPQGTTGPEGSQPQGTTGPQAAPCATQQPGAVQQPSGSHHKARPKHRAKRRSHARAKEHRNHARKGPKLRTAPPPPGAVPDASLFAPLVVGNFPLGAYDIPPFLLPIYQAAGAEYSVPWQVLAAINQVETDYGRNLNVSTAGAVGWMQFLPGSWRRWGVDGNGDGRKDPYNPFDAIFAAARYLRAAGAQHDLRRAIFAYNHADWYVTSVLLRARLVEHLPVGLVDLLTGLAQGQPPVVGPQRRPVLAGGADAAVALIDARAGAQVVAVQDGTVRQIGTNDQLGHYIVLEDAYGNRYTYAHLGSVAPRYAAPRPTQLDPRLLARDLRPPPADPAPTAPASAGVQRRPSKGVTAPRPTGNYRGAPASKRRLFARPWRKAAYQDGGAGQLVATAPAPSRLAPYIARTSGQAPRKSYRLAPLRPGSHVVAGTVLGHLDPGARSALQFSIRPAGRGTPQIDPRAILAGWRLLTSSAGPHAATVDKPTSPGQALLLGRQQLGRLVLADPRVQVYPCGRSDIAAGAIDRRVLATLEFLADSGLDPTVSSLRCGHGVFTSSGRVSEHSTGDAVDIAAVNGIPILGHQGPGSIADQTIERLLDLQGFLRPHQIISLTAFEGADNTLALPDHADHIHVGFSPLPGASASSAPSPLQPAQWRLLARRLDHVPNPVLGR